MSNRANQGASLKQVIKASHPVRPIFPDHQFDFCDPVWVVPLQQAGTIEAIWYRQLDDIRLYRLMGISESDQWWREEKLETACPSCYQPWDRMKPCQCGRSPDE